MIFVYLSVVGNYEVVFLVSFGGFYIRGYRLIFEFVRGEEVVVL